MAERIYRNDRPVPATNGSGNGFSSFRSFDTLVNLVSGLGTIKDKNVYNQYALTVLTKDALEAAYRSDWIARKIIDIPAQDSTRMWREWQAEADDISKLEDLERRFDIQGKVFQAMVMARLYGGSALIMGVDGAGTASEELNLDRVGEDSLKFVHAVSRYELGVGEIERDITSDNYRLPKFYQVSSQDGPMLQIHYSRVVKFIGNRIPDRLMVVDGWGDSILQVVNDAVMNASMVTAGIAQLVHESKVDVIKIPNLSERLSSQEYSDKLGQRMTYSNVLKSSFNVLLMDTLEEWQRISTSFASLPEIFHNYLICAAGAADIPATRLIGQSPRGLNATGEHDTRNYYDRIKSDQNTMLRPAMSNLDEVIQRSALGKFDPDITYDWRSLWQMTEVEQAALAKSKADTYQIDVNAALIDSNALRKARENQLIEDGTYPGLDQVLQDQEAGIFPTEAEQFAGDPNMNPDHPQNLANLQTAQAQAKSATKAANQPVPTPHPKEPPVKK